MKQTVKQKFSALRVQFPYNQFGYNLIKLMFFKYILNKIGVSVTYYTDKKQKLRDAFKQVKREVENNLDKIKQELGILYGDTSLDCIVSFGVYNEYSINYIAAFEIIDSLTADEIKDFIINDLDDFHFDYKYDNNTPKSLCDLIIKLLKQENLSTWLDIPCENGSFITAAAQKYPQDKFLAIEKTYNAYLTTKIRLLLLNADATIKEEDFFRLSTDKPDIIFGNLLSHKSQEWEYIDNILQTVTKDGYGAVVIPEGLLGNVKDSTHRQDLVALNIIDSIIQLPIKLFPYSGCPTALVIFSKHKTTTTIKFVNATSMHLPSNNTILDTDTIINEIKNGGKNTFVISPEKIKNNKYNLTVKQYNEIEKIIAKNNVSLKDTTTKIFRGTQKTTHKNEQGIINKGLPTVYKLLNVSDIDNGMVCLNNLAMLDFHKNMDNYLLHNRDILISLKSTKLKTAIIEIDADEKIIPSGSIMVIRCNENKLNPFYLKAFLDSRDGEKLLNSIQTGTTIKTISTSNLKEMRIPEASIAKQKLIADAYLKTFKLLQKEKEMLVKLENNLNHIYDSMEKI